MNMDTRIFISTHPNRLLGICKNNEDPILPNVSYLISNWKKKIFAIDSGQVADYKSFSKIILLSDELTEFEPEFGITINNANDYLLYHNTINVDVLDNFASSNRIQKQHSYYEEYLYNPVFKIIFNNEISITQKITEIQSLFGLAKEKELKVKTDFLYSIYNGEKPSNCISDLVMSFENLYKCFEENPYNKSLDMLEDETSGLSQRIMLIKLRDQILK